MLCAFFPFCIYHTPLKLSVYISIFPHPNGTFVNKGRENVLFLSEYRASITVSPQRRHLVNNTERHRLEFFGNSPRAMGGASHSDCTRARIPNGDPLFSLTSVCSVSLPSVISVSNNHRSVISRRVSYHQWKPHVFHITIQMTCRYCKYYNYKTISK